MGCGLPPDDSHPATTLGAYFGLESGNTRLLGKVVVDQRLPPPPRGGDPFPRTPSPGTKTGSRAAQPRSPAPEQFRHRRAAVHPSCFPATLGNTGGRVSRVVSMRRPAALAGVPLPYPGGLEDPEGRTCTRMPTLLESSPPWQDLAAPQDGYHGFDRRFKRRSRVLVLVAPRGLEADPNHALNFQFVARCAVEG